MKIIIDEEQRALIEYALRALHSSASRSDQEQANAAYLLADLFEDAKDGAQYMTFGFVL